MYNNISTFNITQLTSPEHIIFVSSNSLFNFRLGIFLIFISSLIGTIVENKKNWKYYKYISNICDAVIFFSSLALLFYIIVFLRGV
jgi:hypothetical protein